MKTISKRWENILENLWTPELLNDMSNFRQSPINYRLCMWNPENGTKRAVKDLIYLLAMQMNKNQWQMLKGIRGRNLGNPLAVCVKGEWVDLDYIRAVLELSFVFRNWHYHDTSTIVDIGGGYGRLCHSFLSTIDVKHYYIVDLVPVLELAQRYLSKVLDAEKFAKVSFVSPTDVDDITGVDLVLNVDSMNEMPIEMVVKYLNFVDKNSLAFYSKNPVGKYCIENSEKIAYGEEVVEDTVSTGILCNQIERFDSNSIEQQVPVFLSTYCPGVHWVKMEDGWAPPWWHYWQVVYRKLENE